MQRRSHAGVRTNGGEVEHAKVHDGLACDCRQGLCKLVHHRRAAFLADGVQHILRQRRQLPTMERTQWSAHGNGSVNQKPTMLQGAGRFVRTWLWTSGLFMSKPSVRGASTVCATVAKMAARNGACRRDTDPNPRLSQPPGRSRSQVALPNQREASRPTLRRPWAPGGTPSAQRSAAQITNHAHDHSIAM